MKIKSVLFFLLVGCGSYESETEEYETDNSDSESYEYFDSEFQKDLEDSKCPTAYKQFVVNNKTIIMEIPSICNYYQIDKGRPVEDINNKLNNNLIINVYDKQQEI